MDSVDLWICGVVDLVDSVDLKKRAVQLAEPLTAHVDLVDL